MALASSHELVCPVIPGNLLEYEASPYRFVRVSNFRWIFARLEFAPWVTVQGRICVPLATDLGPTLICHRPRELSPSGFACAVAAIATTIPVSKSAQLGVIARPRFELAYLIGRRSMGWGSPVHSAGRPICVCEVATVARRPFVPPLAWPRFSQGTGPFLGRSPATSWTPSRAGRGSIDCCG